MRTYPLCVLALLAPSCWDGPLVGPLNEDPSALGGGFGGGFGGGGGSIEGEADAGALDAGAGGGGGGGGPAFMKFSELSATILGPSCASSQCHQGLPPAFAPMSLQADAAWVSMVNRPSTQVPSMLRVAPGDPSRSYLMVKLLGGARALGGTDSIMPLYQPALDAAAITAIRDWITRGAPND